MKTIGLLEICREIMARFYEYMKCLWKRTFRNNTESSGGPPPVKVFILMGQSNMLGMGHVKGDKDGTLEYAVFKKGLYSYLIDDCKKYITLRNVRNVRVMDARDGKMHTYENEFMNPAALSGETIGPEIGIGNALNGDQIMLLKSCIGNRSLGWDLLPPGSKRFDFGDKTYAAYGEDPSSWPKGEPKPPSQKGAWYAGKQYDTDIANAKSVLAELDKYYPGATQYEIEGFFWWQGDKDRYDEAYATMYEHNLTRLITQLRTEFNAPKAKFVLATLGQTDKDTATGIEKLILDAMVNVDGGSGKHPEFAGSVKCVYSHPLSKGGASNGHYNGNAETYMNIGEAMGQAMAELTPSNNNDDADGTMEV